MKENILEDEIEYELNKRGFGLSNRIYHGIMHYCEHDGIWLDGLSQYGEEEKVFYFIEIDYMRNCEEGY